MRDRRMGVGGQFLRFVVVGGVATAAHYVTLVVLKTLLGVEVTTATTVGFLVGAVINYMMNYHWTFNSTRAHSAAVVRFVVVASSGMALNALLVATGVYLLAAHYLVAQVISTALVLFWNFFFNRIWTFSEVESCPKS